VQVYSCAVGLKAIVQVLSPSHFADR